MSREIDNALLTHGGTEDIDIPKPAIHAILTDAVCAGEIARENEALRKQNAALEETNQALAKERDYYKQQARDRDERLAGRCFE